MSGRDRIYEVEDFGACGDGVTLCTLAVQRAVDACGKDGGGTVLFSNGAYVLSTVFLRNNVKVEIRAGVKILGSLHLDDFRPDERVDYPLYQDASHSFFEHSLFVGVGCNRIALVGGGEIDMRSVWDEENKRNMNRRGAKCVALKNCTDVEIADLRIVNATDLAVYFAGCENVDIHGLRVYIDGISPDNCKHVKIHGCDVQSGDDAIVFKSSYTLNRLGECEDIRVYDCTLRSGCNALKFGTESNGGFKNISVDNIGIFDTRICAIAVESVDGAVIDGIRIKNVRMQNVNAPLFIHLGDRMRGPECRKIGRIRNISLENITATGEYKPYGIMPYNYKAYKDGVRICDPHVFGIGEGYSGKEWIDAWQMTSNVCGLADIPLENISLENVHFALDGGVNAYSATVPLTAAKYPEVYVYGRILPAKGIYFRFVKGLRLQNVTVKTYRPDAREDFVFEHVECLSRNGMR